MNSNPKDRGLRWAKEKPRLEFPECDERHFPSVIPPAPSYDHFWHTTILQVWTYPQRQSRQNINVFPRVGGTPLILVLFALHFPFFVRKRFPCSSSMLATALPTELQTLTDFLDHSRVCYFPFGEIVVPRENAILYRTVRSVRS